MDRLTEKVFDKYASHYGRMSVVDRLPDDIEKLRRDRLPPWIREVPLDARILDAGCGQGHLLAALYRIGYKKLHGVDVSHQMLEAAQSLLPNDVQLVQADIRQFLASVEPESFDVIFFHDVLEHLPREDSLPVLQMFHRVLRRGGVLSVRVPNMGSLIGSYIGNIDCTYVTHFTEYSLLQILETAGFDVSKMMLVSQCPRLFFSWRRPHRMVFRFLNYVRWHVNNLFHRMVYILNDMRPRPTVFDNNIAMVARK